MALLKFRIDMNPFSLLYFSCIYDTQFRTLKEVQKSQYYGVGYENGLLIMFPDEYISKSMPKSEQACLKLVKNMIFCFKSGKNPAYRCVSSCALFTTCEALRGQIYMGCVCFQVVEKVNG